MVKIEIDDRGPRYPGEPGSPAGLKSVLPIVTVALAVAFSLFGDMAIYVVLPVHYAQLGLSALQVGILLSANRWVRLITNHFAERLLRKHGPAVLFPASLLAGSLIAAAYATAPSFVVLLILRIIWGLCWSFIRLTGVMTTIGIAGTQHAARSMGVYTGILQVGFVAGTFGAGLLFDTMGFQTMFLLTAAMSLAAIPPAVLSNRSSQSHLEALQASGFRRDRGTLLLEARGFIVSLVGRGLIMSTLGFHLRSRYGDNVTIGSLEIGITTINGALLAAQYIINAVGSPLFGITIDRQGLGRMQIVAFGVAGTSLLLASQLQSSSLLIPLVIVFFMGASASRLAVESQAAIAGSRSYSGLATATDLGSALGPVLGWLGIDMGQSSPVFWVGGGLFIVGAIFTAISPPSITKHKR